MANIFSPEKIIETGGLLLIGGTLAAETGLLIGFILPGDSLLLAAGFFAGTGELNLFALILVCIVGGIVGDNIGYTIGEKTGHRIFKSNSSKLFHKDHLVKADAFYKKHGGKTLILARFLPIIRTFVPMAAGMSNMPRKTFMFYNVIGAIIWATSLTLVGYFLAVVVGEFIDLEKYILPLVVFAALFSFGGAILGIIRDKEIRAELWDRLTSPLKRTK